MTILWLICILGSVFILCLFTFFLVVYLSELRREMHLRETLMKESNSLPELIKAGNIPQVIIMEPSKPEKSISPVKNKKDIN